MNAKWIQFLLIAVVVMAVCIGGLGAWLLPQWGVGDAAARGAGAGMGGAIVAVLYMKMIKRPGGA